MPLPQQDYDRHMLDNAAIYARAAGLDRFPVVDADAHHLEIVKDLAPWIEGPWRRTLETVEANLLIPRDLGDRYVSGRLRRARYTRSEDDKLPAAVHWFKRTMREMGIDYAIVFPTDLLSLGMHPQPEFEVAVAFAYARWMTEAVLPYEPAIKTMLYLPFNDPDASLELVERFGGRSGVAGFMVTTGRHAAIYRNPYMKVYAAVEEQGVPLGFHAVDHWRERPFEMVDNFLAAHTIGFPFYNMVHLVNLVMNGVPERFPRLRIIFMEAGVAWLPFVMARLDTMYGMRASEAPLLRRRPSQYIRDMYFTTQPLEWPADLSQLAAIFEMIDGPERLLFATDYPHWDFDLPQRIYELPFLSEAEKRRILGGNALELFGFDVPPQAGSAG